MLKQQQAEGELLSVYGKLIAITIIAMVLAVFSYRYFDQVERVSAQGQSIEHQRLLRILVTLKSQWLSKGQPRYLNLDWHQVIPATANSKSPREIQFVKMSRQGWPIPDFETVQGCTKLWSALMGKEIDADIDVKYQSQQSVCRYVFDSGYSVSYQLSSGRVIYTANGQKVP
ncbi:hypothetical protein [Shewanella gelidii]|uniref:MSHA biogenesis protein MshF n=1 Tax=Shewanella gelidii TaxID=1642821 RepID=A0A917NCB8_9GAMM|nr:hypothetical protein [Shewanella gelidii]MCL1098754.1 hypothetical protein [Shewanella gelidii]GGI87859.1 MSHA biogenesis protein MshF [Shewanella gelidii]